MRRFSLFEGRIESIFSYNPHEDPQPTDPRMSRGTVISCCIIELFLEELRLALREAIIKWIGQLALELRKKKEAQREILTIISKRRNRELKS